MRWMKTAVLSIACLAFSAGVSRAETNWVGLYGGLSMPTGDFSDAASMGFDIGASGTWMFAPVWGIGADVAYHAWNGSDDIEIGGDDVKFSAIQAGGHFMYMIPSEGMMRPWLKGGLGIYNVKSEVEFAGGGSAEGDESEMGFLLGAGINMVSSPTMSYGIGAAFHSIQTEGDPLNLFTVNVNLMFGVGGPQ